MTFTFHGLLEHFSMEHTDLDSKLELEAQLALSHQDSMNSAFSQMPEGGLGGSPISKLKQNKII